MLLFVLTGCNNQSEDSVVIYTNMEEERNQVLISQLKEKYPEIDVIVQHMSTGNSAAKIKSEGANVEADIVLGLETSHMRNLESNFADLSNFDQSIFLDDTNNSDNYFMWEKYHLSIIIDKNYFENHNLPKPTSYEDLLKEEYKGLIAMPDPKTSGTGYGFFLNAVNIMGEEQAVEYFKKLKNNLREFSASGSGPTNLLKQGEIAIAFGMTSQGVAAINEGYNFEILEFETGSPYNTTSFGIIKGRETKENVNIIFEFLLNEFIKYDKENFVPAIILKNQENKINNYPELNDADMTDIDSVEKKNYLTEKWEQING